MPWQSAPTPKSAHGTGARPRELGALRLAQSLAALVCARPHVQVPALTQSVDAAGANSTAPRARNVLGCFRVLEHVLVRLRDWHMRQPTNGCNSGADSMNMHRRLLTSAVHATRRTGQDFTRGYNLSYIWRGRHLFSVEPSYAAAI
eukprot:4673736-Pleurochrysis_carterae.AAC.1